jgi:hypothetical protein
MKREFLDLPDWSFEINEDSMGVYRMQGRSVLGHEVSATGTDADALIERVRADAANIGSQAATSRRPALTRCLGANDVEMLLNEFHVCRRPRIYTPIRVGTWIVR